MASGEFSEAKERLGAVIYHEDHNYLFVHIQKTGGTSISTYLTGNFGAKLILPAHALLKCIIFEGPKPFIFSVVRNPWERLVSWYEMMRSKGVHNEFSRYLLQPGSNGQDTSFSDFIRRTAVIRESAVAETQWSGGRGLVYDKTQGYLKSLSFNQVDYLTDSKGNMICDRIIMFNRLAEDVSDLTKALHPHKEPLRLPHLNARSSPMAWRVYYQSADDREWVARLYRRDVNQFGFDFET
jgi:hypothetical protein